MPIHALIQGESPVKLWRLSARERLGRQLREAGGAELVAGPGGLPSTGPVLLLNGAFLFEVRTLSALMEKSKVQLKHPSTGCIAAVMTDGSGEPSAEVGTRVRAARCFQDDGRRAVDPTLSGVRLLDAAAVRPAARRTLASAAERGSASGRGITRLVRIARTIADLEHSPDVSCAHIEEAYGLRAPDRSGSLA
jgi:hypothetical protein